MADVHVTTYAELRNAVNNATEKTNIYLDNDIDLNDEYPEGVSAVALPSNANFNVTVYGQGHHIRNILMDSNIVVFAGRYYSSTYYWLTFRDTTFDNVQIQSTGSSGKFLGDAVEIRNCSGSVTLSSNSNACDDVFATSRTYITRSAFVITGANSIRNPKLTIGGDYYCDFNNIKLLGNFEKVILNGLRNSYIHGDFKQTYKTTGSGYFTLKLISSIVNAKIEMGAMPTCTGTSLTCINVDELTFPSGKTVDNLSSLLTKCTSGELQSANALWSKGFPIK